MYANIENHGPNYKTVLDLRKAKKSELYPVKIRVTLNTVQKYYCIGLDLATSDFERIQNGSVWKELKVLKSKITHWENKTKDIIHQMGTPLFSMSLKADFMKTMTKKLQMYILYLIVK